MSLKKNIIANYASQIYVTLIGILILPLYIKYMGAEAYGLVGFFTMLQAWFNLLDFGLTPTIARETARYRGGSMDPLSFRRLFRALSLIFQAIAIVGSGVLLALSPVITASWLKFESLEISDVHVAVQIMAISVALRWMCGLYRGVVSGSEKLIWLSGFNVIIATVRFGGVLPVMWYFGFTPYVFFMYQLMIALAEIAGLWLKVTRLLPGVDSSSMSIGWSLQPVKRVLKFSLTIAFTASIWVMVTQTDKLVLSSILPLAEYGYFTLAVLVANGILIISGPVSNAIMPRMAKLEAEGRHQEVLRIYHRSTQLVAVIAGSASVTLAFCAEPLLQAWTGDQVLADKASPILMLYAVGYGALALAAFPYYLQYARGNLRLHFIGHLLLLFILIPSVVIAANMYGAIGAGYAWAIINLLYLLIWVAVVHGILEPGLHLRWLSKDVLMIGLPMVLLAVVLSTIDTAEMNRLESFIYVTFFGMITFLVALAASSDARNFIFRVIKNKSGLFE